MKSIYLFWTLRKRSGQRKSQNWSNLFLTGKERLSDIQIQHRKAVQETEQIRQKGEAIRQEVSELSETSDLLKKQATTLAEDKKKLLSDNVKLEKQQKKLQQDIEKMVQSKAVMERNIHAYDEEREVAVA